MLRKGCEPLARRGQRGAGHPRSSDAQCAPTPANSLPLERLEEPLERWKETFDRYKTKFTNLFDDYGGTNPADITPTQLASIFKDELGDELRYLAGPPISADDLKVLAETTLAPGILARDAAAAKRVTDTILQALDSRRFPWIAEDRRPTDDEKRAAILASTAMLTRQRVQTDRANESKDAQETAVKAFLAGMGFTDSRIWNQSNRTSCGTLGRIQRAEFSSSTTCQPDNLLGA
jgi:hypothetical protein